MNILNNSTLNDKPFVFIPIIHNLSAAIKSIQPVMHKFLIPALCLLYFACTPSKSENETTEKVAFLEQENFVDTMIVQNTTFLKEMVSNGKPEALSKNNRGGLNVR